MIVEQILVTDMVVFCYLVVDEVTAKAVLIDPAGDFDRILKKIKEHKAEVIHIINTHGHIDHTMGNAEAVRLTGAKVMIHKEDAFMLRGTNYEIDFINDGQSIEFGMSRLNVIHTPGHSGGGICLYTNGCIFTGDTLFTEGMGRTDIGNASQKEIMLSISKKILSFPDDTIIYPGHHYGRKPTSTVSEQKRIYLR